MDDVGKRTIAKDDSEFIAEPETGVVRGEGGAGDARSRRGRAEGGLGSRDKQAPQDSWRRRNANYSSISVCRAALNWQAASGRFRGRPVTP